MRFESSWALHPDIGKGSIGNDISVLTRHFPTYHDWKSIVDGPEALIYFLGRSEFSYTTEQAAQDGHADLMRRVNGWYAEQEAA